MFEKEENKQHYDYVIEEYQHVKPFRHVLGIVGGNDTYDIKGNRADLESDLLGITRPFTWCATRKHLPPKTVNEIHRTNPKNKITVDTTPIKQQEYQLWSYPALYAPMSFKKESCVPKNKF